MSPNSDGHSPATYSYINKGIRSFKGPEALPFDDMPAILTRCEGRAVLDVGGLPEGAVGAADVVVVAADDDRGADLAAGHGVVEGPSDGRATLLVGVEDPRLGTRLPDGKI